jgi:hypothetical protein
MSIAAILAAVANHYLDREAALSVDRQVERFLNGDSDGGVLFQSLYGSVADEPVPAHLLAVIRNGC